jgi:hypothetical protein
MFQRLIRFVDETGTERYGDVHDAQTLRSPQDALIHVLEGSIEQGFLPTGFKAVIKKVFSPFFFFRKNITPSLTCLSRSMLIVKIDFIPFARYSYFYLHRAELQTACTRGKRMSFSPSYGKCRKSS